MEEVNVKEDANDYVFIVPEIREIKCIVKDNDVHIGIRDIKKY